MYLKQVELENFKSFGGKMTIPLMEGYMAVTGPNGSGKSNITDAILFVLGPKSSKAIRAGKLTDLIFDGGKTGKKASYTKVSLVFDNSDGILPWNDTTVRLTRLVKMSANGEDYTSSFFINDQKSTLSEFESLLSKARISADGYNMVQQGDVTRIVQMGSVERRRVLDSISGISSYDADISRAQNERAAANTNLERVTFILEELSRRIEALRKDMDAAQKYLSIQERLKMSKAQLVHRNAEDCRNTRVASVRNMDSTRIELDGIIATIGRMNADIESYKRSIEDVEKEIIERAGPEYEKIGKDILEISIEIANLSDRISRMEEENEEYRSNIDADTETIASYEEDIVKLTGEIDSNKAVIDGRTAEMEAANAEIARIEDELRSKGGKLKELQDELEVLEPKIDEWSNKESELRSSAASLEARKEEVSRALASSEEAFSTMDFNIKDTEYSLRETRKELKDNGADAIRAKIAEEKAKERELETKEDELASAASRINEEYNRLRAEKKATDAIRGSAAVSRIMELRDTGALKGIHGTIMELAAVDDKYETALSIAAGNKMQAIVVDDDQVAADAMAIIKRENLGRATFLPLNKMVDGKPRAKAIMVAKDTEGYAMDLIDFDDRYRAAFWYVFADTLVCRTLTDARRIMGGIRLVTMDGELIEASGAMVGGSVKQTGLKFGAATQGRMDELAKNYRAVSASLESLRAEIKDVRSNLRSLEDRLLDAAKINSDVQGRIGKLESQLKVMQDERARLEESQNNNRSLLSQIETIETKNLDELKECTETLDGMRDTRTKLRESISKIAPAELRDALDTLRGKVYDLNKEILDISGRNSDLASKRNGLDNGKAMLARNISTYKERIDSNIGRIENNRANIEKKNVEKAAMEDIKARMDEGISDLNAKKEELKVSLATTDTERRQVLSDKDAKETLLMTLEQTVKDLDGEIEQLEVEIAQIGFEVELPIPSENELKRIIRVCENNIEELGNVNLRAIEEYDSAKQRYDSVDGESKVLKERIADLDSLMESLNEQKKTLFMKTYDGIDVNFRSIYAELSGGGEAFMKLEDEEDPFAGGLLINAKPRNGKLLRLEALSGGEKSLTALAFIFAIQEFQPSPFYVLDEVDMFLDSVNAEMVAKRVRESSAKAQFIQVSLRKVTLALAQHLIGVARLPSGLSKVIMQPDLAEVSKYEEEAQRIQEKGMDENGGE
ncbi:MAG: chromosome segregation protein SMC [Candidatus Methanomethylophilaceae archaeon]